MPNDNRNLPAAPAPRKQGVSLAEGTGRLLGYLTEKQHEIVRLLDNSEEKFEHFKSVVAMAIHRTPDLLECDIKSFIDSCLNCASDKLRPDGKRGALVSFFDQKLGKKVCQWMPMVRGIIECMYRTGLVLSHDVDVVYKDEPFVYRKGLNGTLEHEPIEHLRKGDENIIWAYALIRTTQGGVFYTAMTRSEIDKVRNISKTDIIPKAQSASIPPANYRR